MVTKEHFLNVIEEVWEDDRIGIVKMIEFLDPYVGDGDVDLDNDEIEFFERYTNEERRVTKRSFWT